MFFGKIFLAVILINAVSCNKLLMVNEDNDYENVVSFVKKVIEGLKENETEFNDVVLLRFSGFKKMKYKVNDISNAIVNAIQGNNLITIPKLGEKAVNKRMKKAKVMVIVTDLYDAVSEVYSLFIRIRIFFHKFEYLVYSIKCNTYYVQIYFNENRSQIL